jgi:hypothetical protein
MLSKFWSLCTEPQDISSKKTVSFVFTAVTIPDPAQKKRRRPSHYCVRFHWIHQLILGIATRQQLGTETCLCLSMVHLFLLAFPVL